MCRNGSSVRCAGAPDQRSVFQKLPFSHPRKRLIPLRREWAPPPFPKEVIVEQIGQNRGTGQRNGQVYFPVTRLSTTIGDSIRNHTAGIIRTFEPPRISNQ